MVVKNTPYYPNTRLKQAMRPQDVDELYSEVKKLYESVCHLQLLPDWKASEVETEVYHFFQTDELDSKIREEGHLEEGEVPDSLDVLYPALPESEREPFLFTLRGVIQTKLSI